MGHSAEQIFCDIFTSFQTFVTSFQTFVGYEILVLSCQRLPTSVRIYLYLQSHASSCVPERELLLHSGVPEIASSERELAFARA